MNETVPHRIHPTHNGVGFLRSLSGKKCGKAWRKFALKSENRTIATTQTKI
jgi:hypothetical protein